MKKSDIWYRRPLRIVALQGGIGQADLPDVPAKLHAMGFNVEQRARPAGSTLDSAVTVDDAPLRDYLRSVRAQGLRFILYLNVHVLEPAMETHRAEWAQQSASGDYPKIYDIYNALCLNSPWRDRFFESLDRLAGYDVDGVFLDGPTLVAGGCFCPSCRARYRRETGLEMDPAADRFDFYRRTQDDFFNEAYRRFKRAKPEGVFYMNLDVHHPSVSHFTFPEVLAYNDMVGTEAGFMFYGEPRTSYLWRISMFMKLVEAVAPDKTRVNFMAADQKPWSYYAHTAAETKLCIASTYANGANVWYGPHGPMEMLDTPGGRAAREMFHFLAGNEQYYENTKSAAKVAVMYSYVTERYYRTSTTISDLYGRGTTVSKQTSGNFTESFQGVCDMLTRSAVPYDVVSDLESDLGRLSGYECIFLPTCACLSESVVEALRKYTAAGGTLVSLFDTSLYDAEGRLRKDFGLGDVLGVSYRGQEIKYGNFNYFSPSLKNPLFKGVDVPFLPAPGYGLDVQATGKARVLARFHGVMACRYGALPEPENPAVVLNEYGQGRSLYLAGTFGETANSYAHAEYRTIVGNAVRAFSRPVVSIGNLTGTVELVVRTQSGRLLAHLVNYTGDPIRPFTRITPLRNLEVSVPCGGRFHRVHTLAGQEDLKSRLKDDILTVKLPELREYEIVVFEEGGEAKQDEQR